ncbi:MAG: hypothetical protein GX631_11045 [Dehalococcoidales bacterium]|nr:hypothetical protein [Dehalococcoidales bacterium]
MITEYAADISDWEEWQKAYRFGVILIFPPEVPVAEVNRLRNIHDSRGQSMCRAHISLTIPLPRPMEAYHLEELKGKISEGDFLLERVSYAVPDETMYFTERVRLNLAGVRR